LKIIADIIEKGLREHPELGSNSEGSKKCEKYLSSEGNRVRY
jgi:hypothetical protein